ncbi:IDEAL domain-containing protein [Halalkalibacter urbisdiaboli]|uniref:IDEAL domain-containing protein n=1 Tax=Halalkalibacter urbisdiaboli TaxID=1960589 RepID=UPI000B43F682|nr:IDEAL domain-containing protein [Halalkalibacter urbisdiaboli]
MNNQFAMDNNVMRQLHVIRSLQKRTETTVQSLYAQAVLEYSLYNFNKQKILEDIDKALILKDKEAFQKHSTTYNSWLTKHKQGKIISENGFELLLTFE